MEITVRKNTEEKELQGQKLARKIHFFLSAFAIALGLHSFVYHTPNQYTNERSMYYEIPLCWAKINA